MYPVLPQEVRHLKSVCRSLLNKEGIASESGYVPQSGRSFGCVYDGQNEESNSLELKSLSFPKRWVETRSLLKDN